jgi:hypothetical protein
MIEVRFERRQDALATAGGTPALLSSAKQLRLVRD